MSRTPVVLALSCVLMSTASRAHHPPPEYAQPAPVYVTPPIVVVPQTEVRTEPRPQPRPGMLAIKYMPGAASWVLVDNHTVEWGGAGFAHSLGLEVRLARWFALRSDLEFRPGRRTWDMLGLKLSLFPSSWIKPYISASIGATEDVTRLGRYSLGISGAGGLDVFLGRYFFLEAEVRYRMTEDECCSAVPTLMGLVGGGVAFF